MFQLPEMSITVTDLATVYETTFEARKEWKNVLLGLGVSSDTIDSIGLSCRDNPKECYREGLKEWLKGGQRSWGDLVKALRSPIVGLDEIADMVKKRYIQPDVPRNDIERQDTVHQVNEELTIFSTERVGSGAFGVVFKGSYKDQPCAVKVLHQLAIEMQTMLSAYDKRDNAAAKFERECEFLKSFAHPNIVQHLSTDIHPKSGGLILVMELIDCSLGSYLSGLGEEPLTIDCQVSLSKDVASGLAYIHSSQKVIHRDLCGDNILLTLSQSVPVAKISDFGMSRLLDPSQMSHSLTAVGQRMGYLPPEALRLEGEDYDYSLDVFSLGVIMVQIVCKVKTIKTAKDRSFYFSQVPTMHRLKGIIIDCLQEDKGRRPTANNVCDALEKPMVDGVYVLDGPPQELTPPLTLQWKKGKDMPLKMGGGVNSVVIGDCVYVGGGDADSEHDKCTVMKLGLQRDEWTKLPQYSARRFAMTSLNSQLVVVGGSASKTWKPTNQIGVFALGKWTHLYPSMNIPRDLTTAVCFNNHIIVAGGYDNQNRRTSSVEVLDVASRRWYIAESLPNPRSSLKSALIGSTLYLMGGLDHTDSPTKVVHKVDLNELITKAVSKQTTPTLWQTIEDTPLYCSAPLSVKGSLLAVGGSDDSDNPSSSIHLYQPDHDTRRWVKVGDLPTARYNCTCSVLPSGEVIVAGGQTRPSSFISSTVNFLCMCVINFVSH